jgi:hypothetical protein
MFTNFIAIAILVIVFLNSYLQLFESIKIKNKTVNSKNVISYLIILLFVFQLIDLYSKNKNEKIITKLEQAKLVYEEPKLEVFMPRLIKDTYGIHYNFSFINFGKRDADSVFYCAMMIMFDARYIESKLSLFKSNHTYQNILKVPPALSIFYSLDSPSILESLVDGFDSGFLLVKYTYVDNFTHTRKNPYVSIYHCDLRKYGVQMTPSIEKKLIELMKERLLVINTIEYNNYFGE